MTGEQKGMSAVTPGSPSSDDGRTGNAAPPLVSTTWAGPIVSLLFLVTVVLFVIGVLTLGPLG
ncbi:hypothetical protein SAMN05443637_12489 [Pseudonocardia thermophila]|uniref:Uncharacterized protein n=1 Tax=Pseudonocardia thermophila TaxID=1848 RepID=A0A1M6ZPI5_PSETH|nr:hypothetical protein [Pseudonocardia thermophila]SHL32245.1 hypothetical protein SAMN05443637_12489 [Pseudonocardia thermophila]